MPHFKVFRRLRNGTLQSAGDLGKAVRQNYSRYSWNLPRFEGSKIFVFASLGDARMFQHDSSARCTKEDLNKKVVFEIWEVEAKNPVSVGQIPSLWSLAADDEDIKGIFGSIENFHTRLNRFWKEGDRSALDLGRPVYGVYGAEQIRLVQKVG